MILVINRDPKTVREARSIFFKMGFNSYGASFDTAEDCIIHRRVDVIVVIDADTYDPVLTFCRNIRIKYPKIALIVTYSEGCEKLVSDLWYDCDAVMPGDSYSTDLLRTAMDSISRKAGYDYGNLVLHGIRLPLESPDAFLWEDIRIDLTPIERLIVRYLMLIYPIHATNDEIFECCFNPSIDSTPENVASHISDINLKSVALIDSKIISFVPPHGYILEPRYKQSATESNLRRLYRIRGY